MATLGRKLQRRKVPKFYRDREHDEAWGWLIYLQQYFQAEKIHEDEMLKEAVKGLRGSAFGWYQGWRWLNPNAGWSDFEKALIKKYLPEIILVDDADSECQKLESKSQQKSGWEETETMHKETSIEQKTAIGVTKEEEDKKEDMGFENDKINEEADIMVIEENENGNVEKSEVGVMEVAGSIKEGNPRRELMLKHPPATVVDLPPLPKPPDLGLGRGAWRPGIGITTMAEPEVEMQGWPAKKKEEMHLIVSKVGKIQNERKNKMEDERLLCGLERNQRLTEREEKQTTPRRGLQHLGQVSYLTGQAQTPTKPPGRTEEQKGQATGNRSIGPQKRPNDTHLTLGPDSGAMGEGRRSTRGRLAENDNYSDQRARFRWLTAEKMDNRRRHSAMGNVQGSNTQNSYDRGITTPFARSNARRAADDSKRWRARFRRLTPEMTEKQDEVVAIEEEEEAVTHKEEGEGLSLKLSMQSVMGMSGPANMGGIGADDVNPEKDDIMGKEHREEIYHRLTMYRMMGQSSNGPLMV